MLTVLTAALAIAGCGPASVTPPTQTAGDDAWQSVISSTPAAADPRSPNICGSGSGACIGAVVAEMTRRFETLDGRCSHEAPFALIYLQVTRGIESQGTQRFHSQAYLNHLDAVFANLYFAAYDNWQSGRTAQVPEAWRIAFQNADRGTVSVLGDILLGMNAHISRDLAFALARAGLRAPDGDSAEADFNRVNGLLGNVTPATLADEAERYDPALTTSALEPARMYPASLQQLLSAWRSESWQNAQRLLAARGPAQRAAVARSIERGAAGRARLIAALTSNLVTGPSLAVRDAYCKRRVSRIAQRDTRDAARIGALLHGNLMRAPSVSPITRRLSSRAARPGRGRGGQGAAARTRDVAPGRPGVVRRPHPRPDRGGAPARRGGCGRPARIRLTVSEESRLRALPPALSDTQATEGGFTTFKVSIPG